MSLDKVLKELEKDGIKVRTLVSDEVENVPVIPTGLAGLDFAIGIKGYPRGRLIELFGEEQSGKSLLSLLSIAAVQKQGGKAILFDLENSFDPTWAEKLGVSIEDLLITQPDYGEQVFDAILKILPTNEIDLIVIDSTAALIPKAEMEASIEQQFMGLQARLMSRALRVVTSALAKTKTTILFINQLRQKIGVMFGEQTTTPGGKALKFYSSLRLKVQKIGKLKHGTDIIGQRSRVTIVKNKLASPFKTVEFDLFYGDGVKKGFDLAQLAVEKGIAEVEGKTYRLGDIKVVGLEKFKNAIQESVELQELIYKQLYEN